MAEYGGYDKNGKYVGAKGAYTHGPDHPLRRKVGYDEDDMKVGLSDTATGYMDNPQHLAREDEYLKDHPILNPGKTSGLHHFGPIGSSYLVNTHGGHRKENDVRGDIRHGLNILNARYPEGRPGGHHMFSAEDVGYKARQHFYVQREEEAKKKAAPPDRSAERSEQFKAQAAKDAAPGGAFHEYETAPTQTKSLWDDSGMDDSPKAAPKAKSKPKNEDTLGGAIRHVIGSLRKKS